MNHTIYQTLIATIALLLSVFATNAQDKDETEINIDNVRITITDNIDTLKKKKSSGRHSIEIGTNGIKYYDKKKKKKHKKLHVGMHFDFGINNIVDNTNYSNSGLLVATEDITSGSSSRKLKSSDFDLRNSKSINFNFWPVWLKQDIASHNVQLETGLGLQFFNYKFNSQVIHQDGEGGFMASLPFRELTTNRQAGSYKNKLGVSYLSVPLMLRFNSNKKNGHRYFIGGGIIGSYKLKSWTKFEKDKNVGNFGLTDWMAQLTAEIGVTGIIKLYGTYSLQSMYEIQGQNGLDRSPFAIGIRL